MDDQQNSGFVGNSMPHQDNKRLVHIGLGLLVAVIAGLIIWLVTLQLLDTDEQRQATVRITADGFVPSTLSIQPGTEVTWINTDNDPHHIASNPHPVHDELPGLDSGTVGPESSYNFTFSEEGEFGYHDHLDPLTNGTVIVR